jgi:hypothetical protein
MVFTMRSNGKMGVEEELIVDELGDPHTQLTVPYKPDTWYQVEFAFDWQRKVFDFFVDGAEIATSVPFENQVGRHREREGGFIQKGSEAEEMD